jgi:hypothetical protein
MVLNACDSAEIWNWSFSGYFVHNVRNLVPMNAPPCLLRLPLSCGSVMHICFETHQSLIRNSGILQAHLLARI